MWVSAFMKNLAEWMRSCNFALPNGTTPWGADLRKLIAGKKQGLSFSEDFLGEDK
jgi:hypothetical protein